ncbi:sigma-B regulation protein RsbU (phosphoserine phosphatase) [Streptomyces sp. V3I8]|uniref:PP2C family protein-serine/threonine phosphatase n=1 Tax=Streptomyces sp. V3I8 TaxID=3042279 RepID=UPI002782A81B|nr:PP2C family protein-serine/threonine phosphatase [Streptomyces sp. V3I8]MDQ1038959.1 sigma-B regulation protein RsbU (phosphoserine phosphatase) [Streptomyces sp. V3I8]
MRPDDRRRLRGHGRGYGYGLPRPSGPPRDLRDLRSPSGPPAPPGPPEPSEPSGLSGLSEARFLAPSAVGVLVAGPALLLDRVPAAVTLSQLLLGCALTAHTVRQRDRLTARLAEVREVVRITQEAVVRPLSRSFAGTHVSTRYHCAVHESTLGGDLYDVAVTPFGLRVLVGDVRGHGLEAVRLTAETVAGFRELAHTVPDLTAVATGLDERLAPDLDPEDFVTALLAEFAPGEVRLVNCGHPAPLRAGQRIELLEPGVATLPLGLGPDPRQYRVRLQPGDRLLLYTDGLTEARAPDGTLFPFLTEAAHALRDPLPDEALDTLYSRLLAHTGTAPVDDLALVLCQPTPAPVPAPHTARRAL